MAAAKADLAEIGDFIKIDNPDRAITFISELLDRCRSLGDMPRAYPLVPRYERFGVCRRVYRNYRTLVCGSKSNLLEFINSRE